VSSSETRMQALPTRDFGELPRGSKVEVYVGEDQLTVHYHANPPLFPEDRLWGRGTASTIGRALYLAKKAYDDHHPAVL
jgi:hypothetical protein